MKYSSKRILWLLLVFFTILSLTLGIIWFRNKESSVTGAPGEFATTSANDISDGTSPDTFIVRFISDNGMLIAVNEYEKGSVLTLPTPPQRIGYIFTGWDENYTNITQDTDIMAHYTDISQAVNVIAADTVYTNGAVEFEVLIGIYGEVNFCGLDMAITYDSSMLEYIEATEVDDCIVLNDATSGTIYANYVSTNNTTGEVAFMALKFKAKTTLNTETNLQIEVNSMYLLNDNEALTEAEYQVLPNRMIIGGTK